MKSYALKSAVGLSVFKTKGILSKVKKLSFVDFRLTSKQDRGGWHNLFVSSSIYDSSRIVSLSSRVKKGNVLGYGISSHVIKLGSPVNASFSSLVKKHKFKEYRLTSSVNSQRARIYGIKQVVMKNKMSFLLFKSFIHKKKLENCSIRSSILKLRKEDSKIIYFRSSFLSYVSPLDSQRKILNGVRSASANFKLLTIGTNGVKSSGVGIYGNIEGERNPVRSRILQFKKRPTLTFYGVRQHVCSIKTSPLRSFEGIRAYGLGLIGVFGVLSGIRSRPIFFSVHRDIIDFDKEKSTAIKLSVFASDIDMALKETQMKINFGSGLFKVKGSVYRKILSPYIEKVEDDTIFFLVESAQKISVSNKATLFDTVSSSQQGLSTDIDESKLPRRGEPSIMQNILFETMLSKVVALDPRSGVIAHIGISNLSVANYIHGKDTDAKLEIEVSSYESRGIGEMYSPENATIIPEEIFRVGVSSTIVNSGNFEQTVLPGIEVERDIYITDENGNVIEIRTIVSRLLTLGGVRAGIHLVSASVIPILNGIRCGIRMTGVMTEPLPPVSFRKGMALIFRVTHNYNGVKSTPSGVKITYTENRSGVKSNPQYLSANIMFTLPRISGNLRFEVN